VFDVGFSELMVIAVVALIVIGPERLPKVARTMGHLFGRLQRYVNDVKADIQREVEFDELRKFKSTVEDAVRAAGDTVHGEVAKTESEFNSLAQLDAASAAPAAIPDTAADSATSSQLDLGLESKSDPASGAPRQGTPA
jgi:sec-independent protein translocase protein TatB